MIDHLTVIPADSVIILDGEALSFSFSAPENLHALQWHLEKGHIEYTDGQPNRELVKADYIQEAAPFVVLWQAEKRRLEDERRRQEEEEGRPPTLEEAKAAKIIAIDAETSAAITAGFDYAVGGEPMHFSYDEHDQQNFADTANAAILIRMGVPGVPESVTWNGWKIEEGQADAEASRTLTRLDLTAESFLNLYMAGALTHKAVCMERGGLRKAAVEAAQTVEEVEVV